MSFPLMELPLELLNVRNDPRPVWRQWLFWLGALVPATLITLGQLHSYYPQFPEGRQILDFKVGKAFIEPPLSALSEFTLSFWPMVIGISYLLNAEAAASIWFFHLLFWAQLVFWAALGYRWQEANTGGKGFQPLDWIHNTEFGAALVLAGLLLLTVRKELSGRFAGGLWRGHRSCRQGLHRCLPADPAPGAPGGPGGHAAAQRDGTLTASRVWAPVLYAPAQAGGDRRFPPGGAFRRGTASRA